MYDLRLCKFGQLTLSQDRCYVSLGGLAVKQNTRVMIPDYTVTNPSGNLFAPSAAPARLSSTFPTALAMFSATFPTSERTASINPRVCSTSPNFWNGIDAKYMKRHGSEKMQTLIDNGYACQPQPFFQRSVNTSWTRLSASTLEGVPRASAFGRALNNDELTLAQRTAATNNEFTFPNATVETFFYVTGDTLATTGANSLWGIQYLASLDSMSKVATNSRFYRQYEAKNAQVPSLRNLGRNMTAAYYVTPTTFNISLGCNYSVPQPFACDARASSSLAMAEFRAFSLDADNSVGGTQGLCFATDPTRPPGFYQHLLTVQPKTYNAIRYWGDHVDLANTPGIDVASTSVPEWSTNANGVLNTQSQTFQATMSSSLSLFNLYGESSGVPDALGNCASYMLSATQGSNNNAVFYAEFGAAAAVKRGVFANGLWLAQENIWNANADSSTTNDNYVLGVSFSAEYFFLYAVTPTSLFFSSNPLDLAVLVKWRRMYRLSEAVSGTCTDVNCATTPKYEFRGVSAVPRADYCAPYSDVSKTPSATASATATATASSCGSGTSTATGSATATRTSITSRSATPSRSGSPSATSSVSTSATASESPSASSVPFAYTYGNVLVSRIQRLNRDNWPCKRRGAIDIPGAWTTPDSTPCNELARVWIDEYSWWSVNTQVPDITTVQTNKFSLVQRMHFPHRAESFPDQYRLTLPFNQSKALGLGQLTQSQDRCSVTIAGFDLPHNYQGVFVPGHGFTDPNQHAFGTPTSPAVAHPTDPTRFAPVTPFNSPAPGSAMPASLVASLPTYKCGPKVMAVGSAAFAAYSALPACASPNQFSLPVPTTPGVTACKSLFRSANGDDAVKEDMSYGFIFNDTGPGLTTYSKDCSNWNATGYPLSVARIGGRGWKDLANTWYADYYSHWMPTKAFWSDSAVSPTATSTSKPYNLVEAPVFVGKRDSSIGRGGVPLLNVPQSQHGTLAYPEGGDYNSANSQFMYRSGEFLAKSWDAVPRAVAYSTVQNTGNSIHRNQVYFATGFKALSSTKMGGSVLGRCWYGAPGTWPSASAGYSTGQISSSQVCNDEFTVTDPGNMDGTTGLCYVGSAATVDLKLLQVRPKANGAIYGWPAASSSTSIDQSYSPALTAQYYFPTLANGTYGTEADFGLGSSYQPTVATANTINSETNGGVMYPSENFQGDAYKDLSPEQKAALPKGFRGCAAFSTSVTSVAFSSPASLFWTQKNAADGFAVQRSDFVTSSGAGYFSPPIPIWGGAAWLGQNGGAAGLVNSTPATSSAWANSRGCAFLNNISETPDKSCITPGSKKMVSTEIDTDVIGIAYHLEPTLIKSHVSGFLYVVTLRSLYATYNPLAPYNPDTGTTYSPTDPDRYWPFWHRLMQLGVGSLGVGAGMVPFPEHVRSEFPYNAVAHGPAGCSTIEFAKTQNLLNSTAFPHGCSPSYPVSEAGLINVNSIVGVAIAPRTCVCVLPRRSRAALPAAHRHSPPRSPPRPPPRAATTTQSTASAHKRVGAQLGFRHVVFSPT